VSSFGLSPASALISHATRKGGQASAAGVRIAERTGVLLCSVLARKGADAMLGERVRREFGVELPRTPRCTGSGPVEFIWAGPNQWLALGEGDDGRAFEQRLRWSLGGMASLVDQSDGRTILRISGARARDALAKGVQIDVHPCAFTPGDTAMTVVAYINVHLWQVDSAPTYDVAMFRSFAVAFWEWLADSAAEYGVATDLS
jgi:methylglutamate dehydrogenase subunit D